MIWTRVWQAFCLGVAAVCLLEAGWRWRRGRQQPAALFLMLGGLLATAVLLAATARPAPRLLNSEPMLTLPPAGQPGLPAPAAPALPPPIIRFGEQEAAVSHPAAATQAPAMVAPRLRIPRLNLDEEIVTIPVRARAWDVSQLGAGVGWLESTGRQPGDDTAMVFAGHTTFPWSATLQTGAFAELQYLTHGTEVVYETGGSSYRYEVTSVRRVLPDDVDALYRPGGSTILLVTCTDWDANRRVYASRLIVEAQLQEPATTR